MLAAVDSRNTLSSAERSRFADKVFDLEAVKAVITRGVKKTCRNSGCKSSAVSWTERKGRSVGSRTVTHDSGGGEVPLRRTPTISKSLLFG